MRPQNMRLDLVRAACLVLILSFYHPSLTCRLLATPLVASGGVALCIIMSAPVMTTPPRKFPRRLPPLDPTAGGTYYDVPDALNVPDVPGNWLVDYNPESTPVADEDDMELSRMLDEVLGEEPMEDDGKVAGFVCELPPRCQLNPVDVPPMPAFWRQSGGPSSSTESAVPTPSVPPPASHSAHSFWNMLDGCQSAYKLLGDAVAPPACQDALALVPLEALVPTELYALVVDVDAPMLAGDVAAVDPAAPSAGADSVGRRRRSVADEWPHDPCPGAPRNHSTVRQRLVESRSVDHTGGYSTVRQVRRTHKRDKYGLEHGLVTIRIRYSQQYDTSGLL